jgi:hypothetical protein
MTDKEKDTLESLNTILDAVEKIRVVLGEALHLTQTENEVAVGQQLRDVIALVQEHVTMLQRSQSVATYHSCVALASKLRALQDFSRQKTFPGFYLTSKMIDFRLDGASVDGSLRAFKGIDSYKRFQGFDADTIKAMVESDRMFIRNGIVGIAVTADTLRTDNHWKKAFDGLSKEKQKEVEANIAKLKEIMAEASNIDVAEANFAVARTSIGRDADERRAQRVAASEARRLKKGTKTAASDDDDDDNDSDASAAAGVTKTTASAAATTTTTKGGSTKSGDKKKSKNNDEDS